MLREIIKYSPWGVSFVSLTTKYQTDQVSRITTIKGKNIEDSNVNQ
jgi:hypothetical protein